MARTVVVHGFGVSVGRRSERLVVRASRSAGSRGGRGSGGASVEAAGGGDAAGAGLRARGGGGPAEEQEVPLFQVGEIVLPARGVSVSVELLAAAAERGITVSFLGASGKPYALLSSPMLTATVSTRREQLRALDDARGAEVCRRVVAGKLRNQAGLLGYFAKGLPDGEAGRRERVVSAAAVLRSARGEAMKVRGASAAAVRDTLMGMEGAAARSYWDGVAALCEGRVRFEGRRREGDVGPVNALLNYGYGILYARVWGVVLNAGLDPFAGFLHTDRPGKPSLVLDMVEELRAPVVDRPVLAYVGLGRRVGFEGRLLDQETRRALAEAVTERLSSRVPYRGRTLRLSSVIQDQARSLATFLRGEGAFRPFTMYW